MNFVEEKKDWEDDIGVEGSSKKSKDSEDIEDWELGDLPKRFCYLQTVCAHRRAETRAKFRLRAQTVCK
jgi:hypothetical protein